MNTSLHLFLVVVWIQWNGMVEWNGGLEWWNGMVDWNGGMKNGVL